MASEGIAIRQCKVHRKVNKKKVEKKQKADQPQERNNRNEETQELLNLQAEEEENDICSYGQSHGTSHAEALKNKQTKDSYDGQSYGQSYGTSHAEELKNKQTKDSYDGQSYAQTPDTSHIDNSKENKQPRDSRSDKRAEKNDTKPKSENKTKKQDEKRSVYRTNDAGNRTNDAGNGIEIILLPYLLLEDSHLESHVWTPEERGQLLKEKNFTNQLRFRTDIYHIYKKGPSEPQKADGSYKSMSYPEVDPSDITVKIHIPELSQMNGLCLNFCAHIRFEKEWTTIDANYILKEGVVVFNCNEIESFYIVSTPRHDKHIVTPDGYEFVSEADIRIKVNFPAGSVSQDENVEFKVIPLIRESMATKILSNPSNCFILAISECLSVWHSVSSFDQPVDIQLPVDDLPGIDTAIIECKYAVFNRKHEGSFRLTNLEVEERDGVPTVTVNSLSEYVILKLRKELFGKLQSVLPQEIEDAIGDKMCCKILFFVGTCTPNNISVMLECVTKDRIEEVAHRRKSMGYTFVQKCQSPDFFFPVNQRIRVNVAGGFVLSKHIRKSYYLFTFFPIALDNFINFPVDRHSRMESAVYGIISFKEDNGTKKDLHVIHYDPSSSKVKPLIGPRKPFNLGAPIPREMEAPTDDRRDRFDKNFDESFFSDKGLLAVGQSLSPDAMFEVAINLNMSKAHYDQITKDCSSLIVAYRHLNLLKAGLKINSKETKIQRLLSALRDSGENTIAEKIKALYFSKDILSKSNLEKMPTVVPVKEEDTTISGKG